MWKNLETSDKNFFVKKFSETELEQVRDEFPDLVNYGVDSTETLTEKEYPAAVKRMKNVKVTGPDGISAQLWKHSQLVNEELYFFIREL